MTARTLLVLLALSGCRRAQGASEESFLTPPPPIAGPEAPAPTPAAAPTPAPAPARPAPTPTPPPRPQAQPEQAQRPEANDGPAIAASHILVMYRGSRLAPPSITRTQAEARTRAEEALRRAQHGEDFATLARQYSDEPGAANSGGALPGRFHHGQMVPTFDQAAFALQVGQLSGIVETPFGYHVIKRTQ